MGEHSGQAIQLGHTLKVRIISVNIAGRQLNLAPVELLGEAHPERRSRTKSRRQHVAKKPKSKRKPTRRKRARK
jgi:hypothetical protein